MNWPYGFATHELREAFIVQFYDQGPAEHDWLKYYLLKPGDVFVEAGAYLGKHGFLAENMGARAILIEPSPTSAAKIKELIKIKGLTKVTVVPKALSNYKGPCYFTAYGNAGDRLCSINEANKVTVEVDTLPNILQELQIQKVALFACDIEGAEVEVTKTLDPTVIQNVALASYHLNNLQQVQTDIIDVLKTKGYKELTYEDGIVYGHI
jgi:FkbM family methyltransferase